MKYIYWSIEIQEKCSQNKKVHSKKSQKSTFLHCIQSIANHFSVISLIVSSGTGTGYAGLGKDGVAEAVIAVGVEV